MLNFAEININDKELFDAHLKEFEPNASEMTFTNFFMWRNFYRFRYTIINNLLCIISVPEKTAPYAVTPIGKLSEEPFLEAVSMLKEYFFAKGWEFKFKKVEEEKLRFFGGLSLPSEKVVFDRDNCDYIYSSVDLTGLSGKKYDGKRNHINKFKKLYDYEYEVLTSSHLEDCLRIMEDWCAERDCETHKGFYCEQKANIELLRNYDRIGCVGAIIKVDGKYEGFTVGEKLNSDTAVIHIEKANSHINGLYTMINQQFCEHEWGSVKYINREQDLGIEGLRKAKLSYHPLHMVNKYTVSIT